MSEYYIHCMCVCVCFPSSLNRKEIDDYFQASETGTSKRNALSIFKIARKLLFIYCQEDKMVSYQLYKYLNQYVNNNHCHIAGKNKLRFISALTIIDTFDRPLRVL